jgi:uncharacterized membrane protein YeaQ/YmgE (transglycosylase-associated protein family)
MGKTSAVMNMLIPILLPVAGMLSFKLLPLSSPIGAFVPLALGLAGGALIVTSRFQRFSSDRWASFGASGRSYWARVAYRSGYALLFLAVWESMVILAGVH